MKIEIGESLGCSYLRHVKQCWLVQANWKTSEHWSRQRSNTELETAFNEVREKFDPDGNVFKQTRDAAQFLKQGEIDIVGIDQKGGVHAMEVAFHEAGLNYGGGAKNKNRVLKKLLRTLMILHAYHPVDTRFSIYFVSPRVNPGVQKPLDDLFGTLRAEYPAVGWHLLTNRNFTEQMLKPTLEKSGAVADTTELFVRAAKLLGVTGILPPEEPRQATGGEPAIVPAPTGNTEKLQPLVKELMNTLLVQCPTLLDEADKCKMMDRECCKVSLGLRIGNFPLLRRREADGREMSDPRRYYKEPYGEFYVCNHWGKNHHVDNAKSLLRFVTKLAEEKAGETNLAQLARHKKLFRVYIDRNETRNRDHG